MNPIWIKLISELVTVVVPMLIRNGQTAEAEEIKRLHSEAMANWNEVAEWANGDN